MSMSLTLPAKMNISDHDLLLRELEETYKEKSAIANAFEAKDSLEMAYVARWSVIEHMVKRITHSVDCLSLAGRLDQWMKYLEDKNRKLPDPIKSFPVDPARAKLPASTDLKAQLQDAPNLIELLDPSKKYRRKRNSIAHAADSIGKKATYDEYKAKVEAATVELRNILSQP